MPPRDEVPDPTDWLGTPLASLSSLESALQCHVCKELFTTPMITSCSHTFCSLCIRRYLSQEGKCPVCRSGDQEAKLRRNWALEECVNVHQEHREKLLQLARTIQPRRRIKGTDEVCLEERSSKRRRTQRSTEAERIPTVPTRATRSRSHTVVSASEGNDDLIAIEDSEDSVSEYCEDDLSARDSKHAPELDDGLVPCPKCQTRMEEEAVFFHLDRCDGRYRNSTLQRPSTPDIKSSATVNQNLPSPTRGARQRLGALNYSLLTEPALRKKLVEIGIPANGPKLLMQRRHMEWMSLWNASCDSGNPQTQKALLRELDTWERAQGRQILNGQGPSGVMAKDFDAAGWTRSNKSDFADLARKAREKVHTPPASTSVSVSVAVPVPAAAAASNSAPDPLEQQPSQSSQRSNGVAA